MNVPWKFFMAHDFINTLLDLLIIKLVDIKQNCIYLFLTLKERSDEKIPRVCITAIDKQYSNGTGKFKFRVLPRVLWMLTEHPHH
jgi:hypothetical protein